MGQGTYAELQQNEETARMIAQLDENEQQQTDTGGILGDRLGSGVIRDLRDISDELPDVGLDQIGSI